MLSLIESAHIHLLVLKSIELFLGQRKQREEFLKTFVFNLSDQSRTYLDSKKIFRNIWTILDNSSGNSIYLFFLCSISSINHFFVFRHCIAKIYMVKTKLTKK